MRMLCLGSGSGPFFERARGGPFVLWHAFSPKSLWTAEKRNTTRFGGAKTGSCTGGVPFALWHAFGGLRSGVGLSLYLIDSLRDLLQFLDWKIFLSLVGDQLLLMSFLLLLCAQFF